MIFGDYKLFCFDGVPRMTLVCSERFTKDGLKEDFYDEAWNHLECTKTYSLATLSYRFSVQNSMN